MSHNKFMDAQCFAPVTTSQAGSVFLRLFQRPQGHPPDGDGGQRRRCGRRPVAGRGPGYPGQRESLSAGTGCFSRAPRVGVFVCHCGLNIGGVADVPAVVEYAQTIPNVEYAQANLFTCSQDAQNLMVEMIKEHHLNRVVVASCSPTTHQATFQDMLRNAGLNKYLFEMANIRNQCTWVHQHQPEAATQKCKDLVRMGVAKARLLEPLDYITVPVNKTALVVGGRRHRHDRGPEPGGPGLRGPPGRTQRPPGGQCPQAAHHLERGLGRPAPGGVGRQSQKSPQHHRPLPVHRDGRVRGGGQLPDYPVQTPGDRPRHRHSGHRGRTLPPRGPVSLRPESQRAPVPGPGPGTGRGERPDHASPGRGLHPVRGLPHRTRGLIAARCAAATPWRTP